MTTDNTTSLFYGKGGFSYLFRNVPGIYFPLATVVKMLAQLRSKREAFARVATHSIPESYSWT